MIGEPVSDDEPNTCCLDRLTSDRRDVSRSRCSCRCLSTSRLRLSPHSITSVLVRIAAGARSDNGLRDMDMDMACPPFDFAGQRLYRVPYSVDPLAPQSQAIFLLPYLVELPTAPFTPPPPTPTFEVNASRLNGISWWSSCPARHHWLSRYSTLAYGDIMHVHSPLRATLRARVRLSETIAFAPPLLLQLLPILPTVPLRPAHLCRPFSRCTSGGV